MKYDYIIIGLNPIGLTLAYYLSKLNKNILFVDDKSNKYLNNNANIYSDSFVNLINLLKEFNVNFYDLFIEMKYNLDTFFNLNMSFILLLINEKQTDLTLDKFINKKYTNNQINLINDINLICKIMLNKNYSEITVNEFLNLLNKELLHKFYQPKEINKLYKIWLKNINNIKILLNSKIGKIKKKNNIIKSIKINNKQINVNNIIYCINNNNTIYLTFHWNFKLDLQNINIILKSDWDLFYIIQSDYTYFNNSKSQTVISIKINNLNKKSTFIFKTALECTKEELINETFRQLKKIYINLPNPTNINLINPKNINILNNYKNLNIININNSYDYIEKSIIESKKLIYKLENKIFKIYEPNILTDMIKITIYIIIIYKFIF